MKQISAKQTKQEKIYTSIKKVKPSKAKNRKIIVTATTNVRKIK